MSLLKQFIRFLFYLHPIYRRFLLVFIDTVLLIFGVWITFWLQLNNLDEISKIEIIKWLSPSIFILGISIFALTGQYFGLTKYSSSNGFYRLSIRNLILVITLYLAGKIFSKQLPPLKSFLLLWLIITVLLASIRLIIRDVFLNFRKPTKGNIPSAAIYGAGSAGAQLALSLRMNREYKIKAFIDDNPQLWGRTINGIQIYSPQKIDELKHRFSYVFIAIPSIGHSSCKEIIKKLENKGLSVFQIPTLDELTSGKARIDSLRPIAIEDLLGRNPVKPEEELIKNSVNNSVICVTGAGGSIGRELCLKIANFSPSKLILLEISEPNLYSINEDLCNLLPKSKHPIPILGNATDEVLVEKIFKKFSVDVVFHAAAYKHVPLVEANPIQGLTNNVFSTLCICQAAEKLGVKKVLLVSTDKAVRPTNVMGASKRLAELVVQAFAEKANERKLLNDKNIPFTCFSMVRFGNVLNSSGSVVPLFQNQIANGGPITLTHKDAVRYFMTIPEAAQLVLQAASLAKEGSEVYLLDMGKPLKILDLAKRMIYLNGLTVKEDSNQDGDIEIQITGLRAGEKLYEELLIDATAQATKHPLIFSAKERMIPYEKLYPKLVELRKQTKVQNKNLSLDIVEELVSEWQRRKKEKN